MKKILLSIFTLLSFAGQTLAIDNNTVEIVFSGTSATVTVASNISSYVTVSSGTSSHVVLTQSESFAGVDATTTNEDGEIIYNLSGTSTDGSFTMTGSFKATVELESLTLTNPSGPAINIQNGKRIAVSAKKGTTNTLTDGANDTYNGCFHCKGHTKFKGKGTLTVVGNSKHAIYSKEYVEIKNLTLNITSAVKDAIHCKQYMLIESGTVNIAAATDDGIQVEYEDATAATGETTDHEDEDSGNFYMTDGTLSISNYGGKAIKADGTITYSGGTQNFDTTDVTISADINALTISNPSDATATVYDLLGRRQNGMPNAKGIYIIKKGKKVVLGTKNAK